MPSHCGVFGNEKADKMADAGAKLDQGEAPINYGIVKAKIRSKKWNIMYGKAKEIYEERREPREIEKRWPARALDFRSGLRRIASFGLCCVQLATCSVRRTLWRPNSRPNGNTSA